jgi:hypothetical protein
MPAGPRAAYLRKSAHSNLRKMDEQPHASQVMKRKEAVRSHHCHVLDNQASLPIAFAG